MSVVPYPPKLTVSPEKAPANAMKYVIYTTCENDDWSNISAKFYGSPFEYPSLLSANPDISQTEILPAGLKIKIPEIVENKERLNLPPWKK